MRSLIAGAFAASSMLFSMQPAAADWEAAFQAAFGPCGDPCVIRSCPGGNVAVFRAAAQAVAYGNVRSRIVVDGPWASACALFADVMRSRVCITPRASFGFHKGTTHQLYFTPDYVVAVERNRFDPTHSPDIDRWVRARKGYPARGMLKMSFHEARRFWPVCQWR
jgi:hypothetical protein